MALFYLFLGPSCGRGRLPGGEARDCQLGPQGGPQPRLHPFLLSDTGPCCRPHISPSLELHVSLPPCLFLASTQPGPPLPPRGNGRGAQKPRWGEKEPRAFTHRLRFLSLLCGVTLDRLPPCPQLEDGNDNREVRKCTKLPSQGPSREVGIAVILAT